MKLHALESEHGEFDRLTVDRFEALARKGADALVLAFRGGALEKGKKPFPRDGTVDALGELGEMLTKAYADRVEMMARAAVAAVRGAAGPVPMAKAGGPFIGPRGGKWADAAHTVPWKDGGAERPKAPEKFEVRTHAAIFGSEGSGTYRIVKREGGMVHLSRHDDSDYGPAMPEAALKHFINDLAGKVDLPKHGNPDIDAVVTGQAELLGKGDDGIAFKVGGNVVKVSTTVPYQPDNAGHRTPEDAAKMLKRQVDTGNKLADLGVPGIQRSEFIQHGDKGFQIKPWVKIPKTLTRSQLDAVQTMVHAMHSKGYALNDMPQVGIDPATNALVMFDVGKAAPDRAKPGENSRFSDKSADMDRVASLYREHGEHFVDLHEPKGEADLKYIEARLPEWISSGKFGFARSNIARAHKNREKEIRAAAPDEASRNAEVQMLAWRVEDALADVDAAEKKAGGAAVQKGGTHRVPVTTHPVEMGPPPANGRKTFPHHGVINFQGLRILVENAKGSHRSGTDGDGHEWRIKMHAHYGEIAGTEGTDGDRLDVYVGDNADSPLAVVVHQQNPQTKAYDEDKVMLGFDTVADALAVYRKQYDRPGFYGGHEAMPIGRLLRWAKDPANRGTRVRKGSSFTALIAMLKARKPAPGQLGLFGAPHHAPTHGGPFIGPRGGKWADPKHTIPWHEAAAPRQHVERHEPAHATAAPVEAPEARRKRRFLEWFGKSKVVKRDGSPAEQYGEQPVTVYHGTAAGGFSEFRKEFDSGHNIYGRGFYFTSDREIAEEYREKGASQALGKVTHFEGERDGVERTHISEHDARELWAQACGPGSAGRPSGPPYGEWSLGVTVPGYSTGAQPTGGGMPLTANMLHAIVEAREPDGRVNLKTFLEVFKHPRTPATRDPRDPRHNVHPTAVQRMAEIVADTLELHPVVPESEVFEVYLSIKNPIDMNAAAPRDAIGRLSDHLWAKDVKDAERTVAAGAASHVSPEAAREHLDWVVAQRAAGKPHGAYLKNLTDTKPLGGSSWGGFATEHDDHSLRLDEDNLLAYKNELVAFSPHKGPSGHYQHHPLHMGDPDTLTWGQVQYMMTDGQRSTQGIADFREWAESEGHDGLRHTGGWNVGTKEHDVWIAWEPTQVKATDSAEFDPSSPDIRKARGFAAIIRAAAGRAP